jgi:hypothetical protein
MKKGQRVYLRHATHIDVLGGGVVSGVDKTGFTVTYDNHGGKFHYFSSQASNFALGQRPFVQDVE